MCRHHPSRDKRWLETGDREKWKKSYQNFEKRVLGDTSPHIFEDSNHRKSAASQQEDCRPTRKRPTGETEDRARAKVAKTQDTRDGARKSSARGERNLAPKGWKGEEDWNQQLHLPLANLSRHKDVTARGTRLERLRSRRGGPGRRHADGNVGRAQPGAATAAAASSTKQQPPEVYATRSDHCARWTSRPPSSHQASSASSSTSSSSSSSSSSTDSSSTLTNASRPPREGQRRQDQQQQGRGASTSRRQRQEQRQGKNKVAKGAQVCQAQRQSKGQRDKRDGKGQDADQGQSRRFSGKGLLLLQGWQGQDDQGQGGGFRERHPRPVLHQLPRHRRSTTALQWARARLPRARRHGNAIIRSTTAQQRARARQ